MVSTVGFAEKNFKIDKTFDFIRNHVLGYSHYPTQMSVLCFIIPYHDSMSINTIL